MTNEQINAILARVKCKPFRFELALQKTKDLADGSILLDRIVRTSHSTQDANSEAYKILNVFVTRTIPPHFSEEQLIANLFEMVNELVLHEVLETFKVDSKHYKDPHPKKEPPNERSR